MRSSQFERAFSLVEMLIVIVLLAITFGLALPSLGDSKELKLREAARLLAADIEYTQNESIAHADALRAVVLDMTAANKYWLAPRTIGQPAKAPLEANAISDPTRKDLSDPSSYLPYVTTYGSDRASGVSGVAIQNTSNLVTDGSLRFIAFDAYGSPLDSTGAPLSSDASITLSCGAATMTISIAAGTGEVSIQ